MEFREHLKKYEKDPEFKKLLDVERKILAVAVKIQEEREKQKLTQKELAQKAGVTQQQLSKIENGYNSNILTYIKVAEALELNIRIS